MKCGECKTEMVRVRAYVCPKCGEDLQDFKDRIRLKKAEQKYRKKRLNRAIRRLKKGKAK